MSAWTWMDGFWLGHRATLQRGSMPTRALVVTRPQRDGKSGEAVSLPYCLLCDAARSLLNLALEKISARCFRVGRHQLPSFAA